MSLSANSRAQIWPLSVKAYHALGEMGLIPEKTELLYGQALLAEGGTLADPASFSRRLTELMLQAGPQER